MGIMLDLRKLNKEQKRAILHKKGKFNPRPGWNCRYYDFKNICNYSV